MKKQKSIKRHEEDFIHISKGSIGRFFLFIGSLLLSVGQFIVLKASWNFLEISKIFTESTPSGEIHQLLIIPMMLLTYLIFSRTIISLIYLIKGKLKPYNEYGLIIGLIFGLIFGLIIGLIFGLINGLIIGLIVGLIVGLNMA